jgi:hypothetical protein
MSDYERGVADERARVLSTLRFERFVWQQDETTPERKAVADTLRLMIRAIDNPASCSECGGSGYIERPLDLGIPATITRPCPSCGTGNEDK